MKGSHQFSLKAVDALPLYIDFTLHLSNGAPDNPREITSHIPVPIRCPYPWFFANPPKWCPLPPPIRHEAVLQRFKHGQMVAIANGGRAPDSDVIVLFAQPNFWVSYVSVRLALTPDASTPSVDPAFYDTWRDGLFDNAPLKDALGKPLGAAEHYAAGYQCEYSPQYMSITECFFNLPDGRVIYLYRHGAYGRNGISWREWTGPGS